MNALVLAIGIGGAIYCSYQVVMEIVHRIENGGADALSNVTSSCAGANHTDAGSQKISSWEL